MADYSRIASRAVGKAGWRNQLEKECFSGKGTPMITLKPPRWMEFCSFGEDVADDHNSKIRPAGSRSRQFSDIWTVRIRAVPTLSITLTGQSMIQSDIRGHAPSAVPVIESLLVHEGPSGSISEGRKRVDDQIRNGPRRWRRRPLSRRLCLQLPARFIERTGLQLGAR